MAEIVLVDKTKFTAFNEALKIVPCKIKYYRELVDAFCSLRDALIPAGDVLAKAGRLNEALRLVEQSIKCHTEHLIRIRHQESKAGRKHHRLCLQIFKEVKKWMET